MKILDISKVLDLCMYVGIILTSLVPISQSLIWLFYNFMFSEVQVKCRCKILTYHKSYTKTCNGIFTHKLMYVCEFID